MVQATSSHMATFDHMWSMLPDMRSRVQATWATFAYRHVAVWPDAQGLFGLISKGRTECSVPVSGHQSVRAVLVDRQAGST
jgi:hypothetical protein